MSDVITFTPEQFNELLKAFRAGPEAATGLGAPKSSRFAVAGLGCGDGGMPGPLAADVYTMLAAGSPRLALCKALGVPLAPFLINVTGQFPDTATVDIPNTGADVKIVQDTLIDELVVRITNQGQSANANVEATMRDYYFNFQSGIKATLDVVGAPRYSVAEKFTPLSTLCDVVPGFKWPYGWILTYQQQLMMAFHASVRLPDAPMEVVCTFRAWVPTNDMFVQMTNREALRKLREECGIECTDEYVNRICR